MRELTYEVLRCLALKHTTIFPQRPENLERVPFYSDLYNVTFNQNAPSTDRLIAVCKRNGYKNTVEFFGGNGFESTVLRKAIKGKHYVIDIYPEYSTDKDPSLHYIKADCIYGPPQGPFEFGFVGGSNSSLCVVLTIEQLKEFFTTVNRSLIPDGKLSVAYFTSDLKEYQSETTFEVEEISYGKYAGMYSYWFMYREHNQFDNSECYYNIVGVSKNNDLAHPKFEKLFCNELPGHVRSWNVHEILHTAQLCGLTRVIEGPYTVECVEEILFKKVFSV